MRRFHLKNQLPMVISTGLLVGIPALPAFTYAISVNHANSDIKQEWKCQAGPDGKWVCGVVSKNVGPAFNANIISSSETTKPKVANQNKTQTGYKNSKNNHHFFNSL